MNNNSTSWIQKRAVSLALLASVLPAWSTAFSQSAAQPDQPAPTGAVARAVAVRAPASEDWKNFRVSAIAGTEDKLSVGLVNAQNSNQVLLAVGKSLSTGVICLSADVDRQTAVFDWAGTMVELSLTGATNLPATPTGEKTGSQAGQENIVEILREKARRGESLSAEEVREYKDAINQSTRDRMAQYRDGMPPQDRSNVRAILEILRERARKGETLSAEEVRQYKDAINQGTRDRLMMSPQVGQSELSGSAAIQSTPQAESEAPSAPDGL